MDRKQIKREVEGSRRKETREEKKNRRRKRREGEGREKWIGNK